MKAKTATTNKVRKLRSILLWLLAFSSVVGILLFSLLKLGTFDKTEFAQHFSAKGVSVGIVLCVIVLNLKFLLHVSKEHGDLKSFLKTTLLILFVVGGVFLRYLPYVESDEVGIFAYNKYVPIGEIFFDKNPKAPNIWVMVFKIKKEVKIGNLGKYTGAIMTLAVRSGCDSESFLRFASQPEFDQTKLLRTKILEVLTKFENRNSEELVANINMALCDTPYLVDRVFLK